MREKISDILQLKIRKQRIIYQFKLYKLTYQAIFSIDACVILIY